MGKQYVLTRGQAALVVLCSVLLGAQVVMIIWACATGRGTKAISPAVVLAAMALVVYSLLRAARHPTDEEPGT